MEQRQLVGIVGICIEIERVSICQGSLGKDSGKPGTKIGKLTEIVIYLPSTKIDTFPQAILVGRIGR